MTYKPDLFYARLNQILPAWAAAREDLRAILQVGSRARSDHPGDPYSDADYLFFVRDPNSYLGDTSWTAEMGEVVNLLRSKTAGNDDELLVMYRGGYTVDYVLTPAAGLENLSANPMPISIFQRGAHIWVDKDGLAAGILSAQAALPLSAPPLIDEASFINECRKFWYVSLYLSKQLRRGDLTMFSLRFSELRHLVLALIELHARTVVRPAIAPWHMGRYMEEWADKRAQEAWPRLFPSFDLQACATALHTVMDLFALLTREIAAALGYPYPADVEFETRAAVAAVETA